MIVSGYQTEWVVDDEHSLDNILRTRDDMKGGEFWLADVAGEYPCLSIIIYQNLSTIHYFPKENHPGFRCLGGEGLPSGGMTIFVYQGCDPRDGIEIPNKFVVPFTTALAVAKEFFRSRKLPASVQWFEL
ncbi:MAG: Imm1 family immunity protein [Promethearchaeota archaeon]